jgi:hypothetical protein
MIEAMPLPLRKWAAKRRTASIRRRTAISIPLVHEWNYLLKEKGALPRAWEGWESRCRLHLFSQMDFTFCLACSLDYGKVQASGLLHELQHVLVCTATYIGASRDRGFLKVAS